MRYLAGAQRGGRSARRRRQRRRVGARTERARTADAARGRARGTRGRARASSTTSSSSPDGRSSGCSCSCGPTCTARARTTRPTPCPSATSCAQLRRASGDCRRSEESLDRGAHRPPGRARRAAAFRNEMTRRDRSSSGWARWAISFTRCRPWRRFAGRFRTRRSTGWSTASIGPFSISFPSSTPSSNSADERMSAWLVGEACAAPARVRRGARFPGPDQVGGARATVRRARGHRVRSALIARARGGGVLHASAWPPTIGGHVIRKNLALAAAVGAASDALEFPIGPVESSVVGDLRLRRVRAVRPGQRRRRMAEQALAGGAVRLPSPRGCAIATRCGPSCCGGRASTTLAAEIVAASNGAAMLAPRDDVLPIWWRSRAPARLCRVGRHRPDLRRRRGGHAGRRSLRSD